MAEVSLTLKIDGWTAHEAVLILEDDPSNDYHAPRWLARAQHEDGRMIGYIGLPEFGPWNAEENLMRVLGYR